MRIEPREHEVSLDLGEKHLALDGAGDDVILDQFLDEKWSIAGQCTAKIVQFVMRRTGRRNRLCVHSTTPD